MELISKLKENAHKLTFGLDYDDPSCFVTSQWPIPPLLYVIYRVLMAMYLVIVLCLSGAVGGLGSYWFIYLTNWTYFILTSYFVLSAVNSTIYYFKRIHLAGYEDYPAFNVMTWNLKSQWVLHNISFVLAFSVSILYWFLVYRAETGLHFINVNTHGINSVLVFVDLGVSAMPSRVLHFIHPFFTGIAYTIFTALYWVLGGTDDDGNPYIYKALDYEDKPKRTAILQTGILLVGLPIMHCLIFSFTALRIFIWNKFLNRNDDSKSEYQACTKSVDNSV